MKKQVIKRTSKSFIFKAKIETNMNEPGDILYVIKSTNGGYYGINNRTGKTFYIFRANMNNPELFELLMQWDYYSTIPDELKTAIY